MVKQQNKYHTVKTVPKYNGKIMETETKSILLTCMYMTTHVPVLPQSILLTSMYMNTHVPVVPQSILLTCMYMSTHVPVLPQAP